MVNYIKYFTYFFGVLQVFLLSTGFPDPEVLWFFSGEAIQECKKFQIEYEDSGSCTLVISDVSLSDVGLYSCQASNAHGHAETSARLTVHQLRAQRHSREGAEKTT